LLADLRQSACERFGVTIDILDIKPPWLFQELGVSDEVFFGRFIIGVELTIETDISILLPLSLLIAVEPVCFLEVIDYALFYPGFELDLFFFN